MDNVKNNIFYRPEIGIERSYQTSGELKSPDTAEKAEELGLAYPRTNLESLVIETKAAIDRLVEIRKVTYLLPLTAPKLVDDIIQPLALLLELNMRELNDMVEAEGSEDNVEIYESPVSKGSNSDVAQDEAGEEENSADEYDDEPFDIEFRVVKSKTNAEMCREQYLRDLTDIIDDFSMGLNGVMQGYIYPLNTVMSILGLNKADYLSYEYEGESVTGIPHNLAHLNDRIVIQDTIVAEKISLFEKTHERSATINAIKAFDAAEMLRERYYDEVYIDDVKDELDIFSNNLLEKARKSADGAYKIAKTNLFKHLDSTNAILKDICLERLESMQAKAILLKNGVDIYNRKDYELSGIINRAG